MPQDYTYPSVYLAYLMFFILAGLAVYFFVKSLRDGYWGKDSEDIKYTVFDEGKEHGLH